jgi:hypothetical protein
MKTIIPLLTLIVLASLEVSAGDYSSTPNRVQPDHTFPIVTPAINNWANMNAVPAMTNWPAIHSPPTRLHVQVVV